MPNRQILRGFVAALAAVASQSAYAAPYIEVRSNWLQLLVDEPTFSGQPIDAPPGISITCGGTASPYSLAGCSDTLSVITTFAGNEAATVTRNGSLMVTNTGTDPFTGVLNFIAADSGFNPGGPDVGISIDNIAQILTYSSSVSSNTSVSDFHTCSLPSAFVDGYTYFSALQCGVSSPDESDFVFSFFDTLMPGDSFAYQYTLEISYSFVDTGGGGGGGDTVPEPIGLALFAPALLALGMLRRRQDPGVVKSVVRL